MQYMMLIYDNQKGWAELTQGQRDKWMGKYGEFTQSIVKSGHFRAGSQLQPTTAATSVRQHNGKTVTTDGPFAETKEQLGGYYLCECKDLDEALAIAQRIPSVEAGGCVEVRPLVPMSTPIK